MKAKTHGILAVLWTLVAGISIFSWLVSGDIALLIYALIFFVFSAEHSIISEIKRKEDE